MIHYICTYSYSKLSIRHINNNVRRIKFCVYFNLLYIIWLMFAVVLLTFLQTSRSSDDLSITRRQIPPPPTTTTPRCFFDHANEPDAFTHLPLTLYNIMPPAYMCVLVGWCMCVCKCPIDYLTTPAPLQVPWSCTTPLGIVVDLSRDSMKHMLLVSSCTL